jgi:hypothetical protein
MIERLGVFAQNVKAVSTAQFVDAIRHYGYEVELFESWTNPCKQYKNKNLNHNIEIIGIDSNVEEVVKIRQAIKDEGETAIRSLLFKQRKIGACAILFHDDFDYEEYVRFECEGGDEELRRLKRIIKRDLYIYLQNATRYYELFILANTNASEKLLTSAARALAEITKGLLINNDTDEVICEPGCIQTEVVDLQVELQDILVKHGYWPANKPFNFKKTTDITKLLYEHAIDNFLSYDAECIEDDRDYAYLLMEHIDAAGGGLVLEQITSKIDAQNNKATIMFKYNGDDYHWEFDHSGDYVAPGFYENTLEFIAQHTPGELVFLPALDQSAALIYLDKDSADRFKAITGVDGP